MDFDSQYDNKHNNELFITDAYSFVKFGNKLYFDYFTIYEN